MTIINFFLYVFNFFVILGGVIAVFVLILNGIFYITSAGKPEKLKNARSYIISAILGAVILVSSWIILNTINPQLVEFQLTELEQFSIAPVDLPSSKTSPGDSLHRIKELSKKIKDSFFEIERENEEIYILINRCECKYALSICLCSGGDDDSVCQPHQCYAGSDKDPYKNHPCPDIERIKELQKSIIVWEDMILYFRNRIFAEIKDIQNDIKSSIDKDINHYEDLLTRESNKNAIDFIEEELRKLRREKNYKKALTIKLKNLATKISETEKPIIKITRLPDNCFYDIAVKCEPTCKIGEDYGCRDKKDGCQPDICEPVDLDNPNPCPIKEIEEQIEIGRRLKPEITQICNEIINIINNIF